MGDGELERDQHRGAQRRDRQLVAPAGDERDRNRERDGRVTAVVGTHTHVPTNDARVLPGGTAYITDVGMTGARGGVIGVKREQSIAVMRTHMPMRYDPADEDPWINAVLIRCDGDGRATAIEPVLRPEA